MLCTRWGGRLGRAIAHQQGAAHAIGDRTALTVDDRPGVAEPQRQQPAEGGEGPRQTPQRPWRAAEAVDDPHPQQRLARGAAPDNLIVLPFGRRSEPEPAPPPSSDADACPACGDFSLQRRGGVFVCDACGVAPSMQG